MTEKRMEDMIHEALESGGIITQDKGHDQKLIVSLMSLKYSLRNVFLIHMYLVVARMKIKFSKELGSTQFIQEIINDKNGKFDFDGEFFEGVEVMTHALRAFFLDHEHKRRIGASTRMDNACSEKFLNFFSQFHFYGKREDDRDEHWEEGYWGLGDGMIRKTIGRRKSLGSGKNNLMF
jgi:hypothetical protein